MLRQWGAGKDYHSQLSQCSPKLSTEATQKVGPIGGVQGGPVGIEQAKLIPPDLSHSSCPRCSHRGRHLCYELGG